MRMEERPVSGQPWGCFALGWGRDSFCIPHILRLEQSWGFGAWCCLVGDFGEPLKSRQGAAEVQ